MPVPGSASWEKASMKRSSWPSEHSGHWSTICTTNGQQMFTIVFCFCFCFFFGRGEEKKGRWMCVLVYHGFDGVALRARHLEAGAAHPRALPGRAGEGGAEDAGGEGVGAEGAHAAVEVAAVVRRLAGDGGSA